MTVGVIMGNVLAMGIASITLSPAAVAANTTAEQQFPLPGIQMRDAIVGIAKPSHQAGLGIVNQRVVTDGVIAVTFINATGGAITPTANEVYRVEWMRPESVQTGTAV